MASCRQHSDAESRVQARIPVKEVGVFRSLTVFSAGSRFPATDVFSAHLAGIGDNGL